MLKEKRIFLLVVLAAIVLQGCAHAISVKQDAMPVFQERSEQIPLATGLWLSDTARNNVITAKVFGGALIFQVGEALELNATKSLEMVFNKVSTIQDMQAQDADIKRKITIEFDNSSRFITGATTLSAHTASVKLNYAIYDEKQNLLCRGMAMGNVTRKPGAAAWVPGIFGVSLLHKELGKIVNEGLTAALENLNDQLLGVCKEAVLTGKAATP